jgi:hypothetical protein
MPPAPKALALRPAVSTPEVPVARDRPKPPDRRLPVSNAAVQAAARAGSPPRPEPVSLGGQDTVGNGAVARAAQSPAPVKIAGRSPGTDPKFASLKKDVQRKKRSVATSHPPARKEAVAAQEAALPPKDDEQAQGKTANAEKMNEAKPQEFDKEAFIRAVEKAIADKAPKNLDEADKFADSGKPDEVKAEVQGRVGEGKADSAEQIATTTAAPPDTSVAVTKKVVPMQADRPPGAPATPAPGNAVPDKLPPEATDMSAGPAQINQEMADAQVTEPQLKKSNEPAFGKALTEKKSAERHSDVAPGQLRKSEAGELKASTAQAKRLGATAMGAMAGKRMATGQQVGAGKTGAKSRDEEKREQVTTILQRVFDTMKTEVEAILNGLDKKVDDQFSRGEKQARDDFRQEHARKMAEYKDRRYSGIDGKFRWVRDQFAGLPAEADKIFDEARANYVRRMRQVISDVATTIGAELNRAKQRIAKGRTELQAEVGKLPQDLRAIGREAAAEFTDKFDELTQSVDDKGTELVDTLATKYTETLKQVDDEIAAEKEKNKGLVAKAIDAVKGVINTILELKRLLLGVLAKAAQAVLGILKDPIGFLGNLVRAVGAGLKLFMRNIGRHLQQGILSWLLGRTAEAGLQLPSKFDARGVLLMIAGLLGLTWPAIRARITRRVPEQAVAAAETAVPLVAQTRRQGVGGMWNELRGRVGDLRKELIDKTIKYVTPTIIIAGITWILSLLNPASAFIRAVKLIIDIVKFIVTQARQIIEFVNAVLDAVIAIARGSGGGVPGLVERALARSIPLLLGLLAAILGVGGIAARVKQIVQAMSRPVGRAVDGVVDKIVGLVKNLWARIKPKPKRKKPDTAKKPDKKKPVPRGKRPDRKRPPARRRPDKPRTARDRRKETRRQQDFDRILTAALREARALADAGLTVEEIKPRLAGIRLRHKLTKLVIVVERIDGTSHIVHFVAVANPKKKSPRERAKLSREKVEADYGILIKNQQAFQRMADTRGLVIDVRPTNKDSVPHLLRGALYKPVDIKAKTINSADVFLGIQPEKKGLVGFFLSKPPKPERETLKKSEFRTAMDRFEMRNDERKQYGDKMRALSRKEEGPGRFVVIEFVVHGYNKDMQLTPIAGDHDLYNILKPDGSKLSKQEYRQLVQDMIEGEFGVMHGAVVYWKPKDKSERKMKKKLVAQHLRGGTEGLVRFAPKQPMRFVFGDTPVGR